MNFEIEYVYIFALIFTFSVGLFFGIYTVKFFSSALIAKLENSLEDQLVVNQQHADQALEILTNKIEEKINFVEQINEVLGKIKERLIASKKDIDILNIKCDKRQELESEIIKLKKIVQRMEKRNGLQ